MMSATFEHFAAVAPDEVAVVDPRGRAWSRAELDSLTNRLARSFRARGMVSGDVVMIAAENCAEYIAVCLGGARAGLNVVPINWHLAADELAHILSDCRPKAVVADSRVAARISEPLGRSAAAPPALVSLGAANGFVDLADFVKEHRPDAFETQAVGRVMAYTSATTGLPKAVCLPSKNASTALRRHIEWQRSLGIALGDGNVHLCCSMLYHSSPLLGALMGLHMGHRVVLTNRWDPESFLALVDSSKVTTTFMVPSMFVRLLKLPLSIRERYSTSSLRFVIHAGAPCPPEIKRRMIDWWGPVIWESYGATEGQGTIVSALEWLQRPGTVGKPIPGSRFKVLDPSGNELGPNEVGVLYMTPYNGDRFEYRGDPEKTQRRYSGDYFTVGDLGYVDEDGYVFLCGRQTEVIIRSGQNIYPVEIEKAIMEHPAVADCAVVGRSHDLFGEVPVALVKTVDGIGGDIALTSSILELVLRKLSAAKVPHRVEYRADLPRDPAGKLFKRLL